MPPIWSVESDDPNLAAVLERLVDIKKGNTLVRGAVGRNVCVPEEASATKGPWERQLVLKSGWCPRWNVLDLTS